MTRSERELLRLVDEGRFEELHATVSPEEIARSWLGYHRASTHSDDPDVDPGWWAVELFFDEPSLERFLAMTLALVEAAETDDELGLIGAGPLEQLSLEREPPLSTWACEHEARSGKFRRALASCYAWPPLDDRPSGDRRP
jgi:hypothetical protein